MNIFQVYVESLFNSLTAIVLHYVFMLELTKKLNFLKKMSEPVNKISACMHNFYAEEDSAIPQSV
jgi:hypothetical protein